MNIYNYIGEEMNKTKIIKKINFIQQHMNLRKWILQHKKVQLPTEGIFTGQALSSIIAEIIGLDISYIYNDYDVFKIDRSPVLSSEYNSSVEAFTLDRYSSYDNIEEYKIIKSSRVGPINLTTIRFKYSNGPMIDDVSIVDAFDINCVQVGYDLKYNKLYMTDAFIDYIMTREVKIINIGKSPVMSLVRLVSKMKSIGTNADIKYEISKVINIIQSSIFTRNCISEYFINNHKSAIDYLMTNYSIKFNKINQIYDKELSVGVEYIAGKNHDIIEIISDKEKHSDIYSMCINNNVKKAVGYFKWRKEMYRRNVIIPPKLIVHCYSDITKLSDEKIAQLNSICVIELNGVNVIRANKINIFINSDLNILKKINKIFETIYKKISNNKNDIRVLNKKILKLFYDINTSTIGNNFIKSMIEEIEIFLDNYRSNEKDSNISNEKDSNISNEKDSDISNDMSEKK